MEKIIWKENQEGYQCEIYVRVSDDFKNSTDEYLKPYCEYVFGIRETKPAWISQNITFVAEDSFTMFGNELLNALEFQINDYKEVEIKVYDHLQDTDSQLVFDCKKDKIVLKGTLGNTTSENFADSIKTTFEIEVDKTILNSLFEVLKQNSKY